MYNKNYYGSSNRYGFKVLGKQPKYHILFDLWFRTMKIRGGVPVGQLDTLTLSAQEAEGPGLRAFRPKHLASVIEL